MWECPDFFELDGKQLLLVSPLDMLPQSCKASKRLYVLEHGLDNLNEEKLS